MNFTKASKRERGGDEVNMTPLIDVVFLLLIFFLITTTFVTNPNLRVDLPKASAQEVSKEKKEIQIMVTQGGEMMVEGQKVDLERLEKLLSEAAAKDSQTLVIVQADRKVPHGQVVEVMDLAQKVGLRRLGIAVEPSL